MEKAKDKAQTVIYCWGLAAEGQIGNNSLANAKTPQKAATKFNPISIDCGGQYSMAVSDDNELYGWGANTKFRMGMEQETDFPIPTRVGAGVKIRSVACGDWHSLALSTGSVVLSAGYNKNGCLGLGSDCSKASQFSKVGCLSDLGIQRVFAGRNISLFLTSAGQLLSCGIASLTGNKTQKDQFSPLAIQSLEHTRIADASAGFSACACVDDGGALYTWGCADFHQLGHGSKSPVQEPSIVKALAGVKVTQVSCGKTDRNAHSGCVDEEGSIYTWGSGYKGKLGHGGTDDEKLPRKLAFEIKAKKLVVGGIHSAFLSREGDIYTFGCGSDGRLGHPEIGNQKVLYKEYRPRRVEAFKQGSALDVSSSYYHMVALIKQN